MKIIIPHIIFSLGLILIILACQKKDPPAPIDLTPKLPEATKTGANTFGCYINGELFVAATNKPTSVVAVSCNYNSISPDELRIQGSRLNDSVRDNVSFRTFVLQSNQSYEMDVIGEIQIGYTNYKYSPTSDCFDFFHNGSNPGSVLISHLDTINRIISGTFEMDLVNDKCEPNLLKITEGRFDLTY